MWLRGCFRADGLVQQTEPQRGGNPSDRLQVCYWGILTGENQSVGTPWWTHVGTTHAIESHTQKTNKQDVSKFLSHRFLLITMWWGSGSTEGAAAGLACS